MTMCRTHWNRERKATLSLIRPVLCAPRVSAHSQGEIPQWLAMVAQERKVIKIMLSADKISSPQLDTGTSMDERYGIKQADYATYFRLQTIIFYETTVKLIDEPLQNLMRSTSTKKTQHLSAPRQLLHKPQQMIRPRSSRCSSEGSPES